VFAPLRPRDPRGEVFFYAFDLLELDGTHLL
jgi:hypothetical protein